ncbi:MAG: AMP-binding protein [Clostridia bacterium]|nr:AMP-binding protein [Clostridia bacterium]
MRILNDFKIPNFKFPKFKIDMGKIMESLERIGESKEDDSQKHTEPKWDKRNYVPTEYKTVKEIFNRSTELFADRTFILEKFNHKDEAFTEITYKQFREDVMALGTGLDKLLGLKGKPVIIIGENTYYWYVSYITMLCSAGIAVPVDKELPPNEIENVIRRSKAEAVIYSTKKEEVIKKVKDNLPEIKYFIKMNSEEAVNGRDVGIDFVINKGKEFIAQGIDDFEKIEIDPEEFKVLIFTSGTTSAAKGVMICNRNLAQNINAVSAYVNLTKEDRLFSVLPLHHTYESTIGFLLPMAVGASIAVCEGLKYIVPNLKETHPTALIAVPLLIENLYKKINDNIVKSKKDKLVKSMIYLTNLTNALKSVNVEIKRKVFSEIYDSLGGKIRYIVSAAAPIDPNIGKWIQDIGICFLQGYGLTETSPIAALTPEFDTKVGSAGKPVICAEIKIDNPNEKGEGEVLIKSETLMLGYYENEEATKEAIQDGWFHSGDIGYLDNEGFLYITGRCKNVIVTQNGKNIYPEEIEMLLGNVPEIKECMVYGKEDEGQELIISAKVIPNLDKIKENHGDNLTDNQVYNIIWEEIKKVNKQLTSYKAIKNLEIKKDEFEKTTTMKIKRYAELNKDKK